MTCSWHGRSRDTAMEPRLSRRRGKDFSRCAVGRREQPSLHGLISLLAVLGCCSIQADGEDSLDPSVTVSFDMSPSDLGEIVSDTSMTNANVYSSVATSSALQSTRAMPGNVAMTTGTAAGSAGVDSTSRKVVAGTSSPVTSSFTPAVTMISKATVTSNVTPTVTMTTKTAMMSTVTPTVTITTKTAMTTVLSPTVTMTTETAMMSSFTPTVPTRTKTVPRSEGRSDGEIAAIVVSVLVGVSVIVLIVLLALRKAQLINFATEYQPSKYEGHDRTDIIMLQTPAEHRERLI